MAEDTYQQIKNLFRDIERQILNNFDDLEHALGAPWRHGVTFSATGAVNIPTHHRGPSTDERLPPPEFSSVNESKSGQTQEEKRIGLYMGEPVKINIKDGSYTPDSAENCLKSGQIPLQQGNAIHTRNVKDPFPGDGDNILTNEQVCYTVPIKIMSQKGAASSREYHCVIETERLTIALTAAAQRGRGGYRPHVVTHNLLSRLHTLSFSNSITWAIYGLLHSTFKCRAIL